MNVVSLADMFVGLSNRLGAHPAIVSQHLTLSYEELVSRAARSARELRARGVEPGSNVGIASRDNAEIVVLMIAIWMLGATAVPIDFRTRPQERALLAAEFDLVILLEDRQATAEPGYVSVLVDRSWTDLIARHDGRPLAYNGESAPAFISLTSGTTGRPLGIVLDHERSLFRLLTYLEPEWRRTGGRLLSALPLSASSCRNHVLSQLLDSGTVYFHPPLFTAGEFSEAVLANRATIVCVVPTVLRGLLELHGGGSTPRFADLSALYCFGAPILPAEKRQARAQLSERFIEGYSSGLSGRISRLSGADMDARPETVGRVLGHVWLQIVDDNDKPLPVGEPGTVRVRSPGMARAIYRGPTRESGDRIKDGWVYPGDIGAVDKEGFLTLLGRTSDIIIRGGANVHPSEVEAVLDQCKGVREAAVVGFASPREGEEIAAFVVADGDVSEAALVAHCRAGLAPDKRPRRFVLVSELPRNANGKIDRLELRRRLEQPD